MALLPPAALVQHVYFDRSDLPDFAPFIRFEPPTTGEVFDARGTVLIQLAREYRRVVTHDEVPLVGAAGHPGRRRLRRPVHRVDLRAEGHHGGGPDRLR
jgi:hypothetical protein